MKLLLCILMCTSVLYPATLFSNYVTPTNAEILGALTVATNFGYSRIDQRTDSFAFTPNVSGYITDLIIPLHFGSMGNPMLTEYIDVVAESSTQLTPGSGVIERFEVPLSGKNVDIPLRDYDLKSTMHAYLQAGTGYFLQPELIQPAVVPENDPSGLHSLDFLDQTSLSFGSVNSLGLTPQPPFPYIYLYPRQLTNGVDVCERYCPLGDNGYFSPNVPLFSVVGQASNVVAAPEPNSVMQAVGGVLLILALRRTFRS